MIEPVIGWEMQAGFAAMNATPAQTILCERALDLGLSVADLIGSSRTRSIAHSRQDIMREIYERTNLSMPQVGRMFGRDHTTVLYSIRASKKRDVSRNPIERMRFV